MFLGSWFLALRISVGFGNVSLSERRRYGLRKGLFIYHLCRRFVIGEKLVESMQPERAPVVVDFDERGTSGYGDAGTAAE
jgi:hypothetical protein